MRLYVDQDLCISCGACVGICPEVFDWNEEEKAWVVKDPVPAELMEVSREAMDACPTEAILEK